MCCLHPLSPLSPPSLASFFFPGTVDRDAQCASRWQRPSLHALWKFVRNGWARNTHKYVRAKRARRVERGETGDGGKARELPLDEERAEATVWWANESSRTVLVGGFDAAKARGMDPYDIGVFVITPVLLVALVMWVGGRGRQPGRARYGEMCNRNSTSAGGRCTVGTSTIGVGSALLLVAQPLVQDVFEPCASFLSQWWSKCTHIIV